MKIVDLKHITQEQAIGVNDCLNVPTLLIGDNGTEYLLPLEVIRQAIREYDGREALRQPISGPLRFPTPVKNRTPDSAAITPGRLLLDMTAATVLTGLIWGLIVIYLA